MGDMNADPTADLVSRVTDMEIRFTHQAELVNELSDLVRAQQAEIDALNRAVTTLREQVLAQADEEFPHERPPHY